MLDLTMAVLSREHSTEILPETHYQALPGPGDVSFVI